MSLLTPLLTALAEPENAARLRSTFWLFLRLVVMANARTGKVTTTVPVLAKRTGFAEATILTQLGHLRSCGFLQIRKADAETIVISFNAARLGGPPPRDAPEKSSPQHQQPSLNSQPNTMNYNTTTPITSQVPEGSSPRSQLPASADSRENRWAVRLTDALGERSDANLAAYTELAAVATDEVLEKALDEALRIPAYKVRKSRGAIFSYLVRQALREQQ